MALLLVVLLDRGAGSSWDRCVDIATGGGVLRTYFELTVKRNIDSRIFHLNDSKRMTSVLVLVETLNITNESSRGSGKLKSASSLGVFVALTSVCLAPGPQSLRPPTTAPGRFDTGL